MAPKSPVAIGVVIYHQQEPPSWKLRPLVLKGKGHAFNDRKDKMGTINHSVKSFRHTSDQFKLYKPMKKTMKIGGDGEEAKHGSPRSLKLSVEGFKIFKPSRKAVLSAEETADEKDEEEIEQDSPKPLKYSDGFRHYRPIKKVVQSIEGMSDIKDNVENKQDSGQFKLPIDGIKHYKPMKKVGAATEAAAEANTQANDKKNNKNSMTDSVEIVQEISSITKHPDKMEQIKSKTGFSVEDATGSPGSVQMNPTPRHRSSNHRPTCGGCPDCPNSVETIFVCPKCRTHYIVRLNIRESKCCSNPSPPCCPGTSAAFADHINRLETRIRKQKNFRHNQIEEKDRIRKNHTPFKNK